MQTKLQSKIEAILKQFPDYWENEELLKHKVIEDLRNYKEVLINALISDELISETYSIQVGDNKIFKLEDFVSMMRYKNYLDNSYTKYSNEIGLTSEGKYLKYDSDVVLDFPHKDGVLEGSMSNEDVGKEEVYYHNILAKDEIDLLFSPKVLTNIKKYDSDGEHSVNHFNAKDNLIIKGNNLIALHSLKYRYSGKVKLIYIDPPYNTDNDSFLYNDKFSHSTWLTFMKNRLEIAKDFLKDDGSIFVQCDDNEQAYLKVLMDEIFGRENYLNTISLNAKVSAGASGGGEDKKLKKNVEYIHIYTKDINSFNSLSPVYKETELMTYINNMKQSKKSFKYTSILYKTDNIQYYKTIKDGSNQDIVISKINDFEIKSVKQISKIEGITEKEVYEKYFDKIMTTTNAQTSIRTRVWNATDNENTMYRASYYPKSGKNKEKKTDLYLTGKQKVLVIWLKDTAYKKNNEIFKKERIGTYWDGFSWINVNKEGGESLANGKKPESLIERILEMASEENDLIMDFFMGSGTTQAVAMKKNRQFIGIEQMDYINNISIPRLLNVIHGDTTGISKVNSWQGGNSFIYVELCKFNQKYIDIIVNASNESEINLLIEEIKNSPYLNIKVDLEKLLNRKKKFFDLTITEQKSELIQILDNNQLYLSYSEIEDDQYNFDDNTKTFNNSFYREGV